MEMIKGHLYNNTFTMQTTFFKKKVNKNNHIKK